MPGPSRLPFLLEDLARELKALCPDDGTPELRLSGPLYTVVAAELASHFGHQPKADAILLVHGIAIERKP